MKRMSKCKNKVELFDTYGILYVGTSEYIFDLDDLPTVESRNWYKDKDGYLVSYYFYAGKRRCVRFHRIIMNAQPHQCIDHINKKKSDNRKKESIPPLSMYLRLMKVQWFISQWMKL